MINITKFIINDLIKNWILLLYTALLLLATLGFFLLEGQGDKAILGVLNLTLLLVPMITVIFSTIYYYNMYEFLILLMAQPLRRRSILGSLFLGLVVSFGLAILAGLGLPLWLLHPGGVSLVLIVVALLLTFIFIGLALFVAVWLKDKARGMGMALFLWVYFVLIFDGLVLLMMYNFSDYPIGKIVLFITFLNPVDLGRIMVLMQTEAAALMGYSGAVFRQFFSEWRGMLASLLIMLAWSLCPAWLSLRMFRVKDL
ncbi:Cu-processing system permease protein [Cyclobacterium lianum]|uniref:Cu-processing system permease protein n=1 Tax=Cyclobacterium lianum TaxID=388280 RepID=A0A1M7KF72_9BACT|nr:ABC transporter permease subunit [Cyclobacterium lianum]SHM63993.1 Cu-processing system permease protein [Cyclobacterium lianum]